MNNLEQEVCKIYKVKPKRISDKMILDLMEVILEHYGNLSLCDLEVTQNAYGFYAEIPEDKKYKEEYYDEKPPVNAGYSDNLRKTILSLLCCDQIKESIFCYDDIRWKLMSSWEKMKEVIA